MRGWVLPMVLAVLTVGSAAVAVAPSFDDSPAPSTTLRPVTPLFSPRRIPGLLSRSVADARLAGELNRLSTDPALGPAATQSCLSVRDPGGRVVYARNPSTPLIPASNMKLLTATAALDRLGADFHYTTKLRAMAALGPDGIVSGDLWLVGSGDPLLATADFAAVAGYQRQPRLSTPLEQLADRAVAAGLRRIDGRIAGDESRYDTQRYVPTWNQTYIRDHEIGPMSALDVNGGFAQWTPPITPAPDPPIHAAATLTALLKARGVTIAGDPGPAQAPGAAVDVAFVDSPPLSDVVGVMLQDSDNLAAELIVKELGVRFGSGGTTEAGLAVVKDTLGALVASPGEGPSSFSAVDGSGLDRADRLTCDVLQAALTKAGEGSVIGRDLPVAGDDGTLRKRFVGTPAAGKVRAKTGSLKGVVALSGWATAADGRSVQFALVANNLPVDATGTALENNVVNALVGYPQAPAVGDLSPQNPVAATSG